MGPVIGFDDGTRVLFCRLPLREGGTRTEIDNERGADFEFDLFDIKKFMDRNAEIGPLIFGQQFCTGIVEE